MGVRERSAQSVRKLQMALHPSTYLATFYCGSIVLILVCSSTSPAARYFFEHVDGNTSDLPSVYVCRATY